jgi:hypothetical protein
MAVKPHGLANRPGEPYPATFRNQWTHRESNSDFRHARAVSSRWTMSPFRSVDRPGNRTPISWLQARHLPVGRAAPIRQRSVWELNPVFRLTTAACSHSTYRPMCSSNAVIPDGIEPSLSCMSRRCLRRWTTGSVVTEVEVEPTGTRLSTSSLCQFAYPVMSQ